MTSNSTTPCLPQSETETAVHRFDSWFDPIEAGLRDRVRDFLHAMFEGELDVLLSRPRYGRRGLNGSDGSGERNPGSFANEAQLKIIEQSALSLGVRISSSAVNDSGEIERAISLLPPDSKSALIALPGGPITVHRNRIFVLATQHRLPAVYAYGYYAIEGGLMSYGPDVLDMWRRAASYVDRILKGENTGELPVQYPVKFELLINITTAKAQGLTVPPTLLARADQVIQ